MRRPKRAANTFAFLLDHRDLHEAFDGWLTWLGGVEGGYPLSTARIYMSVARALAARVLLGRESPLQALCAHPGIGAQTWLMFLAWLRHNHGFQHPLPAALSGLTAHARGGAPALHVLHGLDAAVRLLWREGLPPHRLAELPLDAVFDVRSGRRVLKDDPATVRARALLKITMWAYGGAPVEVTRLDRPAFPRRPWFMDRRGMWLPVSVVWDLAGREPPPGSTDEERGLAPPLEVVDFTSMPATPVEEAKAIHEALKRRPLAGEALLRALVLDVIDNVRLAQHRAVFWTELHEALARLHDVESIARTLRVLHAEGAIEYGGEPSNRAFWRTGTARESGQPAWRVEVNVTGVEPLAAPEPPPAQTASAEEPVAFDAPEIPG